MKILTFLCFAFLFVLKGNVLFFSFYSCLFITGGGYTIPLFISNYAVTLSLILGVINFLCLVSVNIKHIPLKTIITTPPYGSVVTCAQGDALSGIKTSIVYSLISDIGFIKLLLRPSRLYHVWSKPKVTSLASSVVLHDNINL